MTFRRFTDLQGKSQNAAHRSAIMHSGNESLEPTGSEPEMDRGRRWIVAEEELRPELDNRRWIKGDGSREMDDNQSPFLYEATKLQSSADMQTYDVPAAWLHRALFRALFRDTELCSYKPEFQCQIRSRIRS